MGCICSKITFFQVKHTQRIYLTLLSTNYVKIHKIPYVIFETISHFSHQNSTVSFQLKHYILLTKISNHSANFRIFLWLHLKFIQISHVIFQIKSAFFFKVLITLQCPERSFFCTFLAKTLHAIDKSSTRKCKFLDLLLLALKFVKFVMSFLKPRASFSSNFSSRSSAVRVNSSVLFHPKLLCFGLKEPIKCRFSDFQLLA